MQHRKKKKLDDEEENEGANRKHWTRTFASGEGDDGSNLKVFYCAYCGKFGLVMDCHIDELPMRQSMFFTFYMLFVFCGSHFILFSLVLVVVMFLHLLCPFLLTIVICPSSTADGALVVEDSKRTYKLQLKENGLKLIKRSDGVEKQYRYSCSGCDLLVAYQSEPFSNSRVHLRYIVKHALTSDPSTIMEKVEAS